MTINVDFTLLDTHQLQTDVLRRKEHNNYKKRHVALLNTSLVLQHKYSIISEQNKYNLNTGMVMTYIT